MLFLDLNPLRKQSIKGDYTLDDQFFGIGWTFDKIFLINKPIWTEFLCYSWTQMHQEKYL
jgi:hypothetical protein